MTTPHCTACDGKGEIETIAGNWKLCPRCKKEEIEAKRRERWMFPNWFRAVLEHSQSTGASRMLLLVMAYDADKTGAVRLTRSELASRCLCRPQTVMDSIRWLESKGEITTVRKASGRAPAVYRILLAVRWEPKRPKHAPRLKEDDGGDFPAVHVVP